MASELDARKPQSRNRLTNGKSQFIMADVDGRTVIGRRFRDLVEGFSNQLGGNPSPGQQSLIQSAAMLTLLNEIDNCKIANGEPINHKEYCSRTQVLAVVCIKAGLAKSNADCARLVDHHAGAILDA